MDSAPTIRFGSDLGAVRSEDEPLLTGRGRFADDLNLPGQAHGVFVRATTGHARIRRVDIERAGAMPGVLAIITGADLTAAGLGGIPPVASAAGRDGAPMIAAAMPVLADGHIRFVGEAVALVVAETHAH